MRVADFIFETLEKNKINQIFCVTGRGSLFLNDAIKRNKKINCTFTHHEQSAAYAAVAYAQIRNKVACCVVSTGCASTNTVTGVLSAWQDGVPCIFISGQNYLKETTNYSKLKIRTFGQQEANIIPIIKSITKYSVMIKNPNAIEKEIKKALYFSQQYPKGPVWIDIPLDIQNSQIECKSKDFKIRPKKRMCKIKDILYLVKNIRNSSRPIFIIGSGIKSSGAEKILSEVINKFKIPLVYTSSATDVFGSSNKLSLGSLGSQGCSRVGAFAVQNSDLIIVLGSKMNSLTTGPDKKKFARNAKIIAIDLNKEEFKKKNIKLDKLILSDLELFLKKLSKTKIKKRFTKWIKITLRWKKLLKEFDPKENYSKKIGLYQFSNVLTKLMKKESIFVCDSGYSDVIMPTNISFKTGQKCVHPASQGAMGFAIPAILGVHAENQNKANLVCVVGDGSVMMNLQELQTIKYKKVNVKIFIINNNMYGIIKRRQNELFRGRTIGTDNSNGVSNINIKKIAKCFDYKYLKISDTKNFEAKIKKILKLNGQVICEILGLNNQEYIEIGYAQNASGMIVRRPIEDQRPFINREIFKKEMLVKPIDL